MKKKCKEKLQKKKRRKEKERDDDLFFTKVGMTKSKYHETGIRNASVKKVLVT